MKIFKASLETRNFSFEAFNVDAASAETSLIEGLEKHAKQYRLQWNWHLAMAGDINVTEVVIGAAYRGSEQI
jgi:hypothetical protein